MIEKNDLLENNHFNNNYYGTSKSEIERISKEGKVCILEMDVNEANQIYKLNFPANYIGILPPSLDILEKTTPPKVMYIFSDINMPGMTGLELLEQVKKRFPQIKVSMISAYGDKDNYDKAIASGAKEFFTKPIDFDSLKKEINALIS